MEGMLAARDGRLLSLWWGCPSRFSGSPPLPILQCYGVLLLFRISPATTAGASRAARKTERWESLTGGFMV